MFTMTLDQKGTFQALCAAQKWLEQHGYSHGSTCRGYPMPVLKGDYLIAKWRNLSSAEIAELDGKVDGDFREGPLTLYLKKEPEPCT